MKTHNKQKKIDDKQNNEESLIASEENKEVISENEEGKEKQIEIDNLKNQLTRVLADYQNQQKRFSEERSQIFANASSRVVENLIPVLDILEKAQVHVKDQGLGMAISEFKRVLTEEGLEEIVPKLHNPFDHLSMEAVESVAEDGENGTVNECVLPGWRFKDGKIVRYAKVKVFGGGN